MENKLTYKKYKIRKVGKYGNLITKITNLVGLFNNYKHIKPSNIKKDFVELEATDYGFTMLRLIFCHENYEIDYVQS